jgi:hypothetical protein
MTGVENMDLGRRYVVPIGLRLRELEGTVVLAPENQ